MDIKPLHASMAPAEAAQRVYFFERPDGSKIHVDERTAWTFISRPQQTLSGRHSYKYLGTSDGRQYQNAVLEAAGVFRTQGLEAAQDFLRQAWEKELEIALQDKTLPRNFDRVDKTGSPVDTSRLR